MYPPPGPLPRSAAATLLSCARCRLCVFQYTRVAARVARVRGAPRQGDGQASTRAVSRVVVVLPGTQAALASHHHPMPLTRRARCASSPPRSPGEAGRFLHTPLRMNRQSEEPRAQFLSPPSRGRRAALSLSLSRPPLPPPHGPASSEGRENEGMNSNLAESCLPLPATAAVSSLSLLAHPPPPVATAHPHSFFGRPWPLPPAASCTSGTVCCVHSFLFFPPRLASSLEDSMARLE